MTAQDTTTARSGTGTRTAVTTPAQARDTVRRLLAGAPRPRGPGRDAETVLADALLVTSELVTNAIRHGGGLVRFTAAVSAGTLHIAVTDRTSAPPLPAPPPRPRTLRTGGYGWPLVLRLSTGVAITPAPGGKTIRARVPLH
ncbi:ATP-binding protein [Streptomyces sp. NPDC001985]|uniref:ATP-binding protein n=1 Tax=Streptomyces sp. NPDC001985 TaxID=3154406 RepID=UPI0033317E31